MLLQPLCPEAVFQTRAGPGDRADTGLLNLRRNTFDCFRLEGSSLHLSGLLCQNKVHLFWGLRRRQLGFIKQFHVGEGSCWPGSHTSHPCPLGSHPSKFVIFQMNTTERECGPRGLESWSASCPSSAATYVPAAAPWDSRAEPWEQGGRAVGIGGPGRLPSSARCSVHP